MEMAGVEIEVGVAGGVGETITTGGLGLFASSLYTMVPYAFLLLGFIEVSMNGDP